MTDQEMLEEATRNFKAANAAKPPVPQVEFIVKLRNQEANLLKNLGTIQEAIKILENQPEAKRLVELLNLT